MHGMLGRFVFIGGAIGIFLVLFWYLWFSRQNRRRAMRVLNWIERSFEGNGEFSSLQWISNSKFTLQVRLWPSLFRNTSVSVQMHPRELPFSWLFARVRRKQETLTFEADLDFPPSFNLEVQNHRWCGRTRRRFPKSTEDWTIQHSGPFVITTRNDWQRDIMNMMHGLVASRECDCLRVAFSRTSPHFSATIPLDSISPDSHPKTNILDAMGDLAAGASASRF